MKYLRLDLFLQIIVPINIIAITRAAVTIVPHTPPITGSSEVCLTLSVEGGISVVIVDIATCNWEITTGVINCNIPCDNEIVLVKVGWLLSELPVIVAQKPVGIALRLLIST